MKAYLILQDGKVFEGIGFGKKSIQTGEVVFNTAMTGYQEILTDPSYCDQIVVMTYPHIGNYGTNILDNEAKACFASGLVVRDLSKLESNYRSSQNLDAFMKKQGVSGITEIDTRAIVRHIREQGSLPGILAIGKDLNLKSLKAKAKKLQTMEGKNLAKKVSVTKKYSFQKGVEGFIKNAVKKPKAKKLKYKVAVYDFGVKTNILRMLVDEGLAIDVYPYGYDAKKILDSKKYDGVFLSNGPGDPAVCEEAIQNVKLILGKLPIFGICLGHQILALALGLKTYKLKFGHHGANHPVQDLQTKKVEITSQNHGFAVDPNHLPKDVKISHMNLNDNTVSGIESQKDFAFSVQYHPEASPGPHDSAYLFKRFVKEMARFHS